MKKKFDLVFALILGLNTWLDGFSPIFWILTLNSLASFFMANSRSGLARLVLLTGGLTGLGVYLWQRPLATWTSWLTVIFYVGMLGFELWLTYHPKRNGL